MYEKMMKTLTAPFGNVSGPSRRMAELALESAEKGAQRQLDSAHVYLDLGVSQARAASEIRDMDSLQAYLGRQQEIASRFGRRVTDDLEALAGIGRDFSEATATVVQKGSSAPAKSGRSSKAAA